ncbi:MULTISPECIES: endonuclease SmrB [Pseudidiomarina]|uniref:Ribosome rescue factor SmrB n=2 Tax=Pseudidiomarina TaxID=2800384 RepID=A0A368UNV4_9GAMM|nr:MULTISPECIES: endonuclease SmrB [Pseudidiomarina]PWW11165.1 DNA-nicking Smr family endonuclease [Pseudidiomarina maritima]RBP88535.1 DNA-nicking Smr family endonuclease [Pseudidiomarina tainanensis]RCW30488.1 DNA-nicking Smr family endonuclease [Pseudidiomarina tainanensis]
MTKDPNKPAPDLAETSSFADLVKVDKRIVDDSHQPPSVTPKLLRRRRPELSAAQQMKQQQAEFFFSDTYRAHFAEGAIRYLAPGTASHVLKQLRRGDFAPELFLDLHGLTQAVAKQEIAALLYACQKQQVDCCAIMSGHGQGILKENLPHWLVQHPAVKAFHQAPKQWGGDAALLILLELPQSSAQS